MARGPIVLHIGDTHLQAGHPRNADRLAALDQIVAYARTLKTLHATVWPGDLFHAKSTVEDRNQLCDRVQQLASVAPVVITYGNHDQPGDLDIFARLQTMWSVHVVSTPAVVELGEAETPLACFVLPYPHRAGLVGAGVAHEQLGQDARRLLDPVFIHAAEELEDAARHGAITLMVGHVNVGGSLSSVGQPQIGREIELDPALLARLGPIYKGLNHIHKHQTVAGAVYAGSIARMDYGENEPKGLVEVEYSREGGAWVPRWRFVQLQVPLQIQVEGHLSREAFAITGIDGQNVYAHDGELLNDESQIFPNWQGADVRCRYRFKKADVTTLDLAKIFAAFAGCRSLKLDGIPELERDIRAPKVMAAPTLDGKVEAFCELSQMSFTPGLRAKLASLQGMESDRLLAGVIAQADAGQEQLGADALIGAAS